MKFNINDNVRVKLTNHGRKLHKLRYENMMDLYDERGFARPFPYYPVEEDPKGWSTWQLWCLMEEFGEHIHNGTENPFETTIEILGLEKE